MADKDTRTISVDIMAEWGGDSIYSCELVAGELWAVVYEEYGNANGLTRDDFDLIDEDENEIDSEDEVEGNCDVVARENGQ